MNPKRKKKGGVKKVEAAVKPAPTLPAEPDVRWVIPSICVFLAAITLAVFGQTFRFGFVNYDDSMYVYDNPVVQKGLTWAGVHWAFTYGAIGHWHPLTWFSHMLDCQLYGLNAGGHHLTNVLLHMASVILLFLVLRRMTGFVWRSAFVAVIFAIHPLRVESVAWISERKDVLSGFFFMFTLWAYVNYVRNANKERSTIRYVTVMVVFALGLLSKNMLVTLPFVLLLIDYWPLKRATDFNPQVWLRLTVEKIPLFALTVASCVATALVPEKLDTDVSMSLVLRLENAVVTYVTYLWQMIDPSGLACLYPDPTGLLPFWQVVEALGLLVGISGFAWVVRKTCPWILVGWLWYLGMLVPVIGYMQISFYAHADRYTYLPQIGIYLAITWAAAEWAAKWQVSRAVLANLAGGMIMVLMFCAWKQTSYWQNGETLWSHALACTTNNAIAHYSFADALDQEGKVGGAILEYQKSLAINPNYVQAYNNLGNALAQSGQTDEAIAEFQKALAINTNNVETCYNLGVALVQKGRLGEAVLEYQNAVAIDPSYVAAYCNLGNTLLQMGQVDEAIVDFQKAETINPNFALAHYDLGNALTRKGQVDMAITEFQKALAINPNYAQADNNLAGALLQIGRVDEAITEFQKALTINSNNAETYYNLGVALAQKGLLDEAIPQFQKTLAIQPGFVLAQNDLAHIAWVLATSPDPSLRNGPKAIELAQQTDRLTGGGNPIIAATLAAGYASVGKFPEAIASVQRAMQSPSSQINAALMSVLQEQLKCYQAGILFRASGKTL